MKTMVKFLLIASALVVLPSCNEAFTDAPVDVTSTEDVSPDLLVAFAQRHPGADSVSWRVNHGMSTANFRQGGGKGTAWFEGKNGWLGSEVDIAFNQLPQAVQQAFQQSEYATWHIDDIDQIDRPVMGRIYVIEVENATQEVDLYYLPDGSLFKVKVDGKGDQTYTPNGNIPETIKQFIDQNYPGATIVDYEIERDRDDEDYGMIEIDIRHQGLFKELHFSTSHEWVSTHWDVAVSKLPVVVTQTVAQQYAGYRIDDAEFYEKPAARYYLLELEKHGAHDIEVKIDENGVVLSNNGSTGGGNGGTNPPVGDIRQVVNQWVAQNYPGATILDYDVEGNGMIEVEIRHEGIEKELLFNPSGQWLSTHWDVAVSRLPAAVRQAVAQQYAGYKIDDAEFYEVPDSRYYLLELEKRGAPDIRVKIDEMGNIVG